MKHALRYAKIATLFVFVPGIFSAVPAATPQPTQQSSQSVADAARKAQEKQKDAPKAKSVWTNDNIPNTPGEVSIVGQSAGAANSTETAPAAADAGAPTDVDTQKLASDQAKASSDLDAAKGQLDSLKTDLDILQRKYNLDAAQLYSTPDYSKNQEGQAKVDTQKAAIAAKQQEVDAAQKKVDDLAKQVKSPAQKAKPAPALSTVQQLKP